jgi:hypothetical protein
MAVELGEELYRLAQREADPMHLLAAHDALGQTLFYLGDYAAAWRHFAQRIPLIDLTAQRAPRRSTRSIAPGWWHAWRMQRLCSGPLGYPEQALQRCQEEPTLTQEVAHPQNQGLVHHLAAYLHHRRRELSAVRRTLMPS